VEGSPFSTVYKRIKYKHGSQKAIVAVARKMLVIIYNILKHGTEYDIKKYDLLFQKQKSKQLNRLFSNAKKLGYSLVPIDKFSELENCDY
jgi:predicted O-methyltransferase YrrM